jgi:hypothetical protein
MVFFISGRGNFGRGSGGGGGRGGGRGKNWIANGI